MKTHEIFACLKPGYKAVCVGNGQVEVFCNRYGIYFQVDEFGVSHDFKPEQYEDVMWKLVSAGN